MPKNDHVKNALDRLGGSTAGQMAEEIGFNPDVPMPKPKVTGPNHPEGPGKKLINGFSVKERNQMKRDDKAGVSQPNYPQIQEALLKIMKGNKKIGAKIEDTATGRAMADTRPFVQLYYHPIGLEHF